MTPDIWAPKYITRRRGAGWIAFRSGDENGGARGYGDTQADAIRNLEASFPDDGAVTVADLMPGFSPRARADILGVAVGGLRRKLDAAAPDLKQGE